MRVLVLLAVLGAASASQFTSLAAARQKAGAEANPIRKVVTMLQLMMKKVTAEGEKEKELFEKFMCYCKGSGADLAKSIADAEAKVPELISEIEAAEAAMAEATAIREKEAAAFAKGNAEFLSNID